MQLKTTWVELKTFLQDRKLQAQFVEFSNCYMVFGIDANFVLSCKIMKEDPAPDPSDQKDFEDNYLSNANKTYSDRDGSPLQMLKITRRGWKFFQPFFEFTTAKLGSVYSKDYTNSNTNTVTIRFFKLVGGTETKMVSPTQANLDSNCVMTQVDWKLPYNFGIIGGGVFAETQPSTNMRIWVVGAPGVANIEFLQGCNLKLVKDAKFHNDGRVPKLMKYDNPVAGTNVFRIIVRHNVGSKSELMPYFEIFKA